MLQALIESGADEYFRGHLLPRDTVLENLVRLALHTAPAQNIGEFVQIKVLEGHRVKLGTPNCPRFPEEALHQLGNSHARRNRVRIDDDIRSHAVRRLRHIVLRHNHPDCSLLSVATGELVGNYWDTFNPDTDLRESVAVAVNPPLDLVNISGFSILHQLTHVAVGLPLIKAAHLLNRGNLPDNDVSALNPRIQWYESVFPQFILVSAPRRLRLAEIRHTELFLLPRQCVLLLLVLLCLLEECVE